MYLLYEKPPCSKDMSKSGGRLIDLEEEQVGVEYFLHQGVLSFILLQLFLYRTSGGKALDTRNFLKPFFKKKKRFSRYIVTKGTITLMQCTNIKYHPMLNTRLPFRIIGTLTRLVCALKKRSDWTLFGMFNQKNATKLFSGPKVYLN